MNQQINTVKKATLILAYLSLMISNANATVYAAAQSNGMNDECKGCKVLNADDALGSDMATSATLKSHASKTGTFVYERFSFTEDGIAGNKVAVAASGSAALTATELSSLEVTLYNDGVQVGSTFTGSDMTVQLQASSLTVYEVYFFADADFDEIEVKLYGGVAGAVKQMEVHGLSHTTGALPVSWLYLNATSNDNGVNLEWATATEINNDFFSVEVCTDGVSFEAITTVQGAGNSTTTNTYNMNVEAAPFTRYFRIRQTDFNGKNSFSEVVAVAPSASINDLTVRQSDGEGLLQISFLQDNNAPARVMITDLSGRTIATSSLQSQEGMNSVTLYDVNLNGHTMYVVTLVSGNSVLSQKILTR